MSLRLGKETVSNYIKVASVPYKSQDKTVDPSINKRVITSDEGFDGLSSVTINEMPSGKLKTAEISKTGLITYGVEKAGYIDSQSLEFQLPVKEAETFTPTITDQYIPFGKYITGTQTIKGDANLKAENIKKDVSIFGIKGTLELGVFPTGTFNITANDEYDVTSYSSVNVNVPIPEGYLKPIGNLDITENGVYSISNYALATVNINTAKEEMTKIITPTRRLQTILPDEGKVFSSVSVKGVDNSIDTNIKAENIKAGISILGITGTVQEGTASPTGELNIGVNGKHDVFNYASVNVNVPIPDGYFKPSGTLTINENGVKDVSQYQNVSVDIPETIPEGYLLPTGTKTITVNDTYDIGEFKNVRVNVPIPSGYLKPEGEKSIITTASTDVSGFATAKIVDSNLVASNIKKGVSVLGLTGTYDLKLQSKTVSPSKSSQIIKPDTGYEGMSSITVNAVDNTIDSNIKPTYIKKGISILGITGTYEFNNQEKTAIPSKVSQEIIPDEGYSGLSKVIVNPVSDGALIEPSVNAAGVVSYGVNTEGWLTKQSLTYQLPTHSSQTITPSTTDTVISSGKWLSGNITVKGDINLVSENIINGKTIFGVKGNAIARDSFTKKFFTPVSNTSYTKEDLNGLSLIRPGMFYEDKGLVSIEIPDSAISIGNYAFCGTHLKNIIIPDNIRAIGDSAFRDCSYLLEATISNNIKSIKPYTFYNCTDLTTITFGNNIISIEDDAFHFCKDLTNITLPESLTSIGNSAFRNNESLDRIIIPNRVVSIFSYAFDDCINLKKVVISDSVNLIGSSAFSGCSNLTDLTIGRNVNNINENAFAYCKKLVNIFYNGTKEEWNNIKKSSMWKYSSDNITTITCTDGTITL